MLRYKQEQPEDGGGNFKNKKIARRRTLILSIIVTLGYIVKPKLIDLWLMLALTEFSIAYSILKAKFLDKST